MGRSKESSRRKRSAESKDFGSYSKRHAGNTAHTVRDFTNENNGSPNTSYGSTQSFCDVTTYAQIPYYSWTTYFFNQEYNKNSWTVSRINAFIDFIERNTQQSEQPVDPQTDLTIDINLLLADPMLLQEWPSLLQDLNANPQHTFSCMRVAFFEVTLRRSTANTILSFTTIFRFLRLNSINIINYQSLNASSQFNLSVYGKLVSISGIVINISLPKLSSSFVVMRCSCKREIIVKQENGTVVVPSRTCNVCGKRNFKRSMNSIHQFEKVEQIIQIKNHRSAYQKIEDDVSLSNIISVKLADSLIDKFVPGDKIRVIGIPRATVDLTHLMFLRTCECHAGVVLLRKTVLHLPELMIKLGALKSTTPGLCPLYIDAISTSAVDDEFCGFFDRGIIEKIQSEPDVFGLLVKSLCPTVQGHEMIKAALILGLFSGNFGCGLTRDYLHILIIGDLGLSKTQLLRTCAQVAPKGVYVRGSSMKSLEPTMINVREAGMKDLCLDSGVFTLASGSVCCIDELDRISVEHQSIHRCMDKRVVNITNSEIKLELKAQTALVGMINPIGKRYDPSKTVIENVNASPEFLSRFDMVFVMRDYPDTYRDKVMCDRLLDVHTKRKQLTDRSQFSDSPLMGESPSRGSRSLMERLATPDESRTDILPQKFLYMYINHARMYVNPQISSGTENCIQLFCTLRYDTHKKFVNTKRLILILVTLSQARAKLALRAEVTEEDLCEVIEILGHTMSIQKKNQPSVQPLGSSSNSNKLTTNKINQFLTGLRTESESLGKTTFTKDELQNVARKENVTGHIFFTLLTRLNEQGYLLKVSSNIYKFVSN